MAAHVVRTNEKGTNVVLTPLSDYKCLTKNQFLQFARCYLKNNVMSLPVCIQLPVQVKSGINNFFESIPDYILEFATETHKKLILMHIKTNLEYGFGVSLSDSDLENIYVGICRLSEIRMNSNKK